MTARSVFSKYSIVPTADINFGPMLVSTKKTKSFVIENKGEFDFRYSIQKLVRSTSPSGDRFGKGRKKVQSSRDGSASSKTDMGGKTEGKAFKGPYLKRKNLR